MSGYELYVFFLCLTVFALLTMLFSAMLYYIVKTTLKTIRHGLEDERIIKEYEKQKQEKPIVRIICKCFCAIVLAVALVAVCLSVGIQVSSDRAVGDIPTPKVVLSSSMAYKNDRNTYLKENGLNDQFDRFDLILTRELPGEFELELYDIVVYDYYGTLIIHRIIGIEEPNEQHPDHRQFLLRGDANWYSDDYPVTYEQMLAIYRGEKIPYVGSFFAFMQSPAGYLCILLVVFAMIATPVAEKKFATAKLERLKEIGYIEEPVPEEESTTEDELAAEEESATEDELVAEEESATEDESAEEDETTPKEEPVGVE